VINTPIAEFTQTTNDKLYTRNGAAFYRVTPVKGARVDGTVSVGVSCHDYTVPGWRSWEPKRECPAMWIDYTPNYADDSYSPNGGRSRETITVNGREYGEGFAAGVGGRVEFIPAEGNDHLAKYYPQTTVDGSAYYLRASVSQFDHVTDKARELLNDVAAAIAAEFVTDERWLAFRISQAEYRVKNATKARDDAQSKLDDAVAALEALR
jgi:hypothetical protein